MYFLLQQPTLISETHLLEQICENVHAVSPTASEWFLNSSQFLGSLGFAVMVLLH